MGCRFFFGEVRTEVDVKFPNLSGSENGDPKAAVAAKNTINGYGWLNSLYEVAQDGVFTVTKHSPVESVLNTGLYEVLTYLSWKAAGNEFERQLNELHKK